MKQISELFVATLIGAVGLVGCSLNAIVLPASALPDDLPAELLFVMENSDRFAVDFDDPLFDMTAGTVLEDLQLEGCWGATLISDLTIESEPVAAFYFVMRFDTGNDTYESWLWNEILLFPNIEGDAALFQQIIVGGGETGSFSIVGQNQVILQQQHINIYAPSLGDPSFFELMEQEFTREMDFLVTASGNKLRMHFDSEDRDPLDPGDELIYLRFDCPE